MGVFARRIRRLGVALWALVLFAWAKVCAASTSFSGGIETGIVQDTSVTENSGIAASHLNPNVLWFQQDSGNGPHVFATTAAGANLVNFTVSNASNTDWEDIATGPGPTAGVPYLYVGDIGDNNNNRAKIEVYRAPEPTVSDTQTGLTETLNGAVKYNFVYPDGMGHNAESLFVDPLTKDLYIITKHINPVVYEAPYSTYANATGTVTLTQVASFTDAYPPTAADISPDGSEIIVRGYPTNSAYMFQRPTGGTVASAFSTTPISIPLVDQDTQGEGIGFDPSGHGYYIDREGVSRAIYYFDRLPPAAFTTYWDGDATVAGTYLASGAGMGGSGTWDSTSLKWYNGSCDAPWQDSNDAVFWGTAGTVTLSAARSVNNLTFKTTGYNITGSTLTLTGGTVNVDSGVTATISSVVAGSVALTKEGAGTLTLTNSSNQNNGYTGGTIINAGILSVASGALSHSGGGLTINNGATFQFNGANGTYTLAAARSVTLGPGGGVIDSNGNSDSIAGAITGTSLTKTGSGTVTLTGTNTYTGETIVSGGTLKVNKDSQRPLLTNAAGTDIQTGRVVFDYTGASAPDVRSAIISRQIKSTTATAHKGLGYVDDGSSTVTVMYTYFGDANLDGTVGSDDFDALAAHFGESDSNIAWANGDFNYDGTVNALDFNALATNYGQSLSIDAPAGSLGALDLGELSQVVPEPSAIALLCFSALGMRRRHRN